MWLGPPRCSLYTATEIDNDQYTLIEQSVLLKEWLGHYQLNEYGYTTDNIWAQLYCCKLSLQLYCIKILIIYHTINFHNPHQLYEGYNWRYLCFIWSRISHLTLQPEEQLTWISHSGDKSKRWNVIKALCLLLGADYCSDIITIDTADHTLLFVSDHNSIIWLTLWTTQETIHV